MFNKVYALKTHYGKFKIQLSLTTYRYDNSLAIQIIEKDGGPFATLTVCIDHPEIELKPNQAFVDTNNCDWAPDFIETNHLGTFLGKYGHSGFCTYPLYEFDLDAIKNSD